MSTKKKKKKTKKKVVKKSTTAKSTEKEEDRHVEELKKEKRKKCEEEIKSIYELYSRDKGLEKIDFGTTIRSLNLNPTELDVENMLKEFPNNTISLEEYTNVVTDVVLTGAYKGSIMVRDSEDTILKAFETLDKEKKGYIETNILMDFLKKQGEPFSDKEVIEMTHAAEDCEIHVVKYELSLGEFEKDDIKEFSNKISYNFAE